MILFSNGKCAGLFDMVLAPGVAVAGFSTLIIGDFRTPASFVVPDLFGYSEKYERRTSLCKFQLDRIRESYNPCRGPP